MLLNSPLTGVTRSLNVILASNAKTEVRHCLPCELTKLFKKNLNRSDQITILIIWLLKTSNTNFKYKFSTVNLLLDLRMRSFVLIDTEKNEIFLPQSGRTCSPQSLESQGRDIVVTWELVNRILQFLLWKTDLF